MKQLKALPLLGQQVVVVEATNPTLVGVSGVVDFETVHTLSVAGKTVHKNSVTLQVQDKVVAGNELLGTINRIKVA